MIKLSKRALIVFMSALVLIGFAIASIYYESQNNKVDPRVIEARELYEKYDQYAAQNNYPAVFNLLDSVEDVYQNIPHYQNSYEIAVIENNRAAAYLTMAINNQDDPVSLDGVRILTKDSLLNISDYHLQKAIHIYTAWIEQFHSLDRDSIESIIKINFFIGLSNEYLDKKEKYLENRVEEIQTAQLENKRRLSVALTNYGIILRHREKYEEAIEMYLRALELWDRNLAAKNNLNALLGRPMEKRSIIQKLFPPEKDKE